MTSNEEAKVLLTVKEAAQLLGLTCNRTYELIAQAKLPAIRFGPRSIRVPRAGLEEWAAKMAEEDVTARKAEFAPPSLFGEIHPAPGVLGIAQASRVYGRRGARRA